MFEYNFFPENYDANIRPPDGKGHFLTSHFHTLNSNFISHNYQDNVRICFSSMGKIKIFKINVDDYKENAGKYNVRGIPNLILFCNGEILDQIVGAVPKDVIKEMLDKFLQ